MSIIKPKRALISVSDKTGIVEFAKSLTQLGIEILSTGGTYKALKDADIPVKEVSSYTDFPEIMGGRVKTLHPKIHGGILGRRDIDAQIAQQHQIDFIDLVIVNLYPFTDTINTPNCSYEQAIENIDIGGPTMLRAAAKNHNDVGVVVDSQDYAKIVTAITENNGLDFTLRQQLALKAFRHTAEYDAAIVGYFEQSDEPTLPHSFNAKFTKKMDLRYGENPHQNAAFYVDSTTQETSVATAKQLQGKALSYNNIADTDAALECVKSFDQPACVIVKHANPCGVAIGSNTLECYEQAFKTDPTSAFGGIIAFNRELSSDTLAVILERQFVEVIIAPSITAEAQHLATAKPNIRILVCGEFNGQSSALDIKQVNGGVLVQDRDLKPMTKTQLTVVSKRTPTAAELDDLMFAWKVANYVKSNAIVYAKEGMTIGVGAGQMSRVYSAKIAGIKAADENLVVEGSVMASDAFFPFRDGIDAAAKAGIKAVIQPGGSMRDNEVIQAADEAGIAMVFTGIRHFRH